MRRTKHQRLNEEGPRLGLAICLGVVHLAGVSPLSRACVAFVLASKHFGVVWLYYLTVASDHRVGA